MVLEWRVYSLVFTTLGAKLKKTSNDLLGMVNHAKHRLGEGDGVGY